MRGHLRQLRGAVGQYVLVAGAAAAMMLWGLGTRRLNGHEALVAVTAQTMAAGDRWIDEGAGLAPPATRLNRWLVPVFNGEPRLVKTPLAYWSVAGLLELSLPADEFTSRLPSAAAAIALALVTFALGRRMFSSRAAVIGALALAASVGMVTWGRSARPDAQMTFWMTAAMACFFCATESPGRRRQAWVLAGCVALGLANLAKQFVPLFVALPVAAYLCYLASERNSPQGGRPRRRLAAYMLASAAGLVAAVLITRRPALRWWPALGWPDALGAAATMAVCLGGPLVWYAVRSRPWHELRRLVPTALPGAVIVFVLFVPWLWYMWRLFPHAGAVFSHEALDRAMGTGGWLQEARAPFRGFYLQSLAMWVLPWIVFLVGALPAAFMDRFREHRRALVFLALWIFALVLLFSAAVGARAQYILPALPAACLLVGYAADEVFFRRRWIGRGGAGAVVAAHAAAATAVFVLALAAAAVLPAPFRPRALHVAVVAGLAAAALGLSLVALHRRRAKAAAACFVGAMAVAGLAYLAREDLWQGRGELAAFGRAAAEAVPVGDRVAAWPKVDAAVIYYFGRDVPSCAARRQRLVRLHGRSEGERLWREWLLGEGGPTWLFAERQHAAELWRLGFVPARLRTRRDTGSLMLLRRRPRRRPPGAPSRSAAPGSSPPSTAAAG
jgi:4-amino-4-deoxy-L-arabinose transferase-like glycosyltransferase